MTGQYRLNESFWSIQGEGQHAGETAVFLRLQGCPVGCEWCDSPLTWYAGGVEYSALELGGLIARYPPATWVIITGGEPIIHDLDPLLTVIRHSFKSYLVGLETSGAFPFKGVLRPDWITLSPKYPVHFRVDDDVLIHASELKYVVDTHFDQAVAVRQLQHREDAWQAQMGKTAIPPCPVYLMPEGSPPSRENVDRTLALLRHFSDWRFGPRLQYAYPSIMEGEGQNNNQYTKEEARERARARRLERDAGPDREADRSVPGADAARDAAPGVLSPDDRGMGSAGGEGDEHGRWTREHD